MREKLQDGETVVLQKKNDIAAMFFLEVFFKKEQNLFGNVNISSAIKKR